MSFFQHPNAIVESKNIGEETRIWAFVHILPEAIIGKNCNLCDHVFIENDVVIGDRVTIKSGVQLWDGIKVENDVFIGPNATFTNDVFPRSKQYPTSFEETVIREGASIGANATILPGITIGEYAMVGAGTVVTKDVPPHAIVVGNPARIVSYSQASYHNSIPEVSANSEEQNTSQNVGVKGTTLHKMPHISDLRGDLTFGEYEDAVPFLPRRYFLVYNVPSKDVRGEHAHIECHQFLVCVKGHCAVVVDDGENRVEIRLDRPDVGLHIPPMVWATQYKYSSDAVLMVLASEFYKAEDYIRSYNEFLEKVEMKK